MSFKSRITLIVAIMLGMCLTTSNEALAYSYDYGYDYGYGYDYDYGYGYGYGYDYDYGYGYGYDYDEDYEDYEDYDDNDNDYDYDTCIVVDIQSQSFSVFQNTSYVFGGSVVTGQYGVSDTPKGTYEIYGKYEDLEIYPGYHASYWMPFNGAIGLHDADEWREASEYGGKTYTQKGSHGCVNLPLYAAKKIYEEYAGIGTVVIVK